ncbi:Abi-alpha family protein [soil metagenome]
MSTAEEPGSGESLPVRPTPQRPAAPTRLGALRDLAASVARRAPVLGPSLEFTERELARVESLVWREVRHRLDAAGSPASGATSPSGHVSEPRDEAARELLAQLLAASVEQSAQEAQALLFIWLLEQLHPDEARILAALSDGTCYPVIHVCMRGHLGTPGPAVLENASSVGRAAGVALPDAVPAYLSHLRMLGLVSVGPESALLVDGYEILLTETVVRQAERDAGGHSRIVRRSLRLTALGHALWDACSAPQRALRSPPGRES